MVGTSNQSDPGMAIDKSTSWLETRQDSFDALESQDVAWMLLIC
jgi:hypothetical protein